MPYVGTDGKSLCKRACDTFFICTAALTNYDIILSFSDGKVNKRGGKAFVKHDKIKNKVSKRKSNFCTKGCGKCLTSLEKIYKKLIIII